MHHADTIYALASAPGKAGVAVLRISGPEAREALVYLGVAEPLVSRMATLVKLAHEGVPLDQALALNFVAPHSFTGEDVVELHTHGSRAVIRQVLAALSACPGLRMAEPGEFTRRAFINGKMDLLEAEGLADLIDADSPAQHAQAMRQLGGALSARITALRESVLIPLALLEAYIDFPDEEIPESALMETTQRIEALVKEIRALLDDGGFGEKIREGLNIVIFGPPNAGKSSLLNALARRDVAIVSAEAGTTRDLIEIQIEIGGYSATLIDTAGLREAEGLVEVEGVRRARERIAKADIRLAVFDIVTIAEQISDFKSILDESTLLIGNKSDLQNHLLPSLPLIAISTKTNNGLDALLNTLHARIEALSANAPSPLITRARHREAFTKALASLERFSTHAPLEIMCEELRIAASEIGKITGKIHVDDLLDVIFSRFCIGK